MYIIGIDMLHNTYKILAMNKKELMNTIQFSESTIYNFRNHRSKQVIYILERNYYCFQFS